MLYVGAVEGSDRFLGPAHVYRMTDVQAVQASDHDRLEYSRAVLGKKYVPQGNRWYADNTREPIRDETLREGLVAIGAVLARDDLPTTSGLSKYALKKDFAALFDPSLQGTVLDAQISAFQAAHLSKSAIASKASVMVTFPNGETRSMAPGPSSIITKAVVEVFARRFLDQAAVLWLSESSNKVVAKDENLSATIGLQIEADRNLPDLILVDLGPDEPLIVFVEVVATDGAVTQRRQEALLALTDAAGFERAQIAFLTAYRDRDAPGFRKTVSGLAWGSFAWFASEPERIVILRANEQSAALLSELVSR